MTTGQLILFILITLTHVIFSVVGTSILLKSKNLANERRRYNIILLWTIPLIWYLLVRTIHKRTPGSHEVPIKNDVSSNNSYESGLGAPGANISNR